MWKGSVNLAIKPRLEQAKKAGELYKETDPHFCILSDLGGGRGHRKFPGFLYHSKYQTKATMSSAERWRRGTSSST